MKIKAILFASCIGLLIQSRAQDIRLFQSTDTLKNSLFLGYGLGTAPEWEEAVMSAMLSLVTFGLVNQKDVHASGVFFVGFQHAVSKKLMAGGTFAFEKISGTTYAVFSQNKSSFVDSYYSILLGIKYKYNFTHNNFQFYGRADAGLLLNRSDVTGTDEVSVKKTFSKVAFQLSPICVRYGRNISGFCELGFGHLGLISAGLDLRF